MNALAQIAAKSLVSLATSLVTEKFIHRIVVLGLEYLAKSTKNKLDDRAVKIIKDTLNQ